MNPAHPSSSSHHDDSAAAVALRGASLAFRKKPAAAAVPSPSPIGNGNGNRGNGALTAAAAVGTGGPRSPARAGLAAQTTGSSGVGAHEMDPAGHGHGYGQQAGLVAARLHQLGGGGSQAPQHQQPPPGAAGKVDPKSASLIAATLAASRNASPGPKSPAPAPVHRPRRETSRATLISRSGSDAGAVVVDSGSIAPTGSLISMFEGTTGQTAPSRSRRPASPRATTPLPTAVGRERPRAASPRRGPTPPPAISIHRASLTPLPKAAHAKGPSVDAAARAGPRPESQETAPAKTRQSSPPAVARAPKQPRQDPASTRTRMPQPSPSPVQDPKQANTQGPAFTGSRVRQPSPPPVIRVPKKPKPQESASTSSQMRQPSPPPLARVPKQPKTREPASTSSQRRPSPPPAATPERSVAKTPAKPLRIQPPGPSVVTSTPEVLSPRPVRPVKPSLVPTVASPAQASPGLSPQTPSPDPQKRSSPRAKPRPPTPPKPRGSPRLTPAPPGMTRGYSDTPSSPYKASLNVAQATSRGTAASTSPSGLARGSRTPPPFPGRRLSVASAPSSPTLHPSRRRLTNASTSNLEIEALANAIVAGSLASSRLTPHSTGPSLPPPSLPKRRRSPRLLQTLRQPATSPDEDEERNRSGKGHRRTLRSGKHAHHEGARKRWREEVTARERKRYEAVWASNRGWLLEQQDGPSRGATGDLGDGVDTSECVANVVVRELWRRSRLPEDELAEVWDLVDRESRGMLSRQEFVVGMWLLDQRLRGRKIPQRVSDSVWGSANGVRVKRPKAR